MCVRLCVRLCGLCVRLCVRVRVRVRVRARVRVCVRVSFGIASQAPTVKLLPKNVLADEQLQRELLDRLAFYRECVHRSC